MRGKPTRIAVGSKGLREIANARGKGRIAATAQQRCLARAYAGKGNGLTALEKDFFDHFSQRMGKVRSVLGKRYIYIRNYMPHKPYGQHVGYMFVTPTTQVWKKLYDESVRHIEFCRGRA